METYQILKGILQTGNRRTVPDFQLARWYKIPTSLLLEAVSQHRRRFPATAAFKLSYAEWLGLKRKKTYAFPGNHLPVCFMEEGIKQMFRVFMDEEIMDISLEILEVMVALRNDELTLNTPEISAGKVMASQTVHVEFTITDLRF
jgi:hypothetical protein